jgi:hypothetical protein
VPSQESPGNQLITNSRAAWPVAAAPPSLPTKIFSAGHAEGLMGTSRYLLDFLGACCFASLLIWSALPDPDSSILTSTAASNSGPALAAQEIPNVLSGVPYVLEANRGQAKPEIQFLSRGKDYSLWLTREGFAWRFSEGTGPNRRTRTARLRFLNGGRTIPAGI